MKFCILITDISHFVAQAVAVELLKQGYRVRGLVKTEDLIESSETILKNHLDDLSHLTITTLNTEYPDKASAIKGCDAIFHIVSPPPILNESIVYADWIRILHHETLQWLQEAKDQHIKKFVLTSSILALRYSMGKETMHLIDGQTETEPQWETLTPLSAQIVKSDLACWDFVRKNNFDNFFTAIYLPCILGPFRGFEPTPFIQLLDNMINGKFLFFPKIDWPAIDIRDIVQTHLEILKHELLDNKRLILADDNITFPEIASAIITRNPELKQNMPNLFPLNFLNPLIHSITPHNKRILEEVGGTLIANSTYTKQLLQTTFISAEEAIQATITDLLS